jgi:hypothetical protein
MLVENQNLFESGKRTREGLEKALKEALTLITAEDAAGWFASCGYPVY